MADRNILVIGAGMGGLTAALRLARAGHSVRIVEARTTSGGLAGGQEYGGFAFDGGPYILLDRPGLEWAFAAVGLDLVKEIPLQRIDDIYDVQTPNGDRVHFHADLQATAEEMECAWPGSGWRYMRHVQAMTAIYCRLEPLQRQSRPDLWSLLRSGAWRDIPFLLRSLQSVLVRTELPQPVCDALAIWTHIAGQRVERAPSPLAFVPALLHGVGAYYPPAGIGQIPQILAQTAVRLGVKFDHGVKVTQITRQQDGMHVQTRDGETLIADAVISNSGLGTYLHLASQLPTKARGQLERLPLQSPGVMAFLAVKGPLQPPYLRFHLPGGDERCRCLILPGVLNPQMHQEGWYPARLIVPMDHARAQTIGIDGQRDYLDRLLRESWWQRHVGAYRVLATRIPAEWGAEYHLYRDSMNPVMTAEFMRAGRLAHRSPYLSELYLAGSATHPGQWVSFCAISGILAAERLLEDLRCSRR